MSQIIKEQGKGIIMISSEMPELVGMCDRIYVMSEGRLMGEISRSDFSQELIMQYATGVKKEQRNEEIR
jgi:inositol transport system ATP-binding protein